MPSRSERSSERNAEKRVEGVFKLLVSYAPNGMRLIHLRVYLSDMTEELIEQALDTLIEQGRVISRDSTNEMVTGRTYKFYSLTNPEAYPMKEFISIGGVDFPRMIQGDVVGAEDLNVYSEALAVFDAKIENRITNLAADLTRRYWANIAILFALFVAVFALILRASDPVLIEGSDSAWKLAQMSMARLLPLAVILLVFPILIWLFVRKI